MKEIITSNHYKGEAIKTAEEVYDLALQGKGVYCSAWKRISPAAFLVCWQTNMLINFIKKGYLFKITPIQKKG
jgi:hypothetical protein